MGHSVEKHLAVTPDAYDVEIRKFVPGYDAMLDEVASALLEHLPGGESARVIDLGAGTGALAAMIAARLPDVHLTLLDADPEMLAQARPRFTKEGARVEFRVGSFADPLPTFHAAVASLSLHHVHDRDAKRDVYANILRSLAPGGILVNADAVVPAAPALGDPVRKRWAAHLVAHGDTEAEAFARFAQWAKEDRYFGVDEEIAMLESAGFREIDVRWRLGPTTVIVARRA